MDLVKISKQIEEKDFNPFEVDLSEIKDLSKMIPSAGVIDLNIAEELATQFVRGADVCVELLSIAVRYEGRMITQKKKAWSEAMYIRAKEKELKTAKEKEAYADSDEEYLYWQEKAIDATAFKKWLENKYEVFVKAHHLSKSIFENNKRQEPRAKDVAEGVKAREYTEADYASAKKDEDGMFSFGGEDW